MTAIDAKLTLDALIVKASAKAFTKIFKQQGLTITQVKGAKSSTVIVNADKLSLLQLKASEKASTDSTFS